MKTYKVAVLPGDGIGPEVMEEAIKVLGAISKKYRIRFEYKYADVGGIAYDKHGSTLPEETIKICEKSDAILFGSVGGPKWDNLPREKSVERGLLNLRKHFDFFANLRPATVFKELRKISPLREDIVKNGFDLLVVRELSSGVYFGKRKTGKDFASDEMIYRKHEVERIAKSAFEIALKRKNHLTCVDKSNVLASSVFFRKIVTEAAKKYPKVKLDYLYVDNATAKIIKKPYELDVIVTTNMFGDILSDEAAAASGSLGMLASASLNEKGFGMYEPGGGSAPRLTGKNKANPIAQILSAAMMLRYSFDMENAAKDIEKAIKQVLAKKRTYDIIEGGVKEVGTKEMGSSIAEKIKFN
jgi:3-isopropylmalate dehydrogenase